MPQLGATFVPGGHDDYYMPEVVAPAPQRVMPEVPQNIQNDLQRMELEAREINEPTQTYQPVTDRATTQNNRHPQGDDFVRSRQQLYTHAEQEAENFRRHVEQSAPQDRKPLASESFSAARMDAPTFSPFPKVKGENIPPSDEEKEDILASARDVVLHSNQVSMQLAWARDALMWIEVATEAQSREWKRDGKGRERPPTPKVQHELRVEAVNIIEYLASQGHPEATFMRGKWQEFGKFGYRENKKEAYLSYKAAADLNYGRAEYRIGMLYENSNDIDKAIKHYTIGAEQFQDSASNYRLGMMNLMGQHGFRQDFQRGLELIHEAADTADEDAPQGAYVFGMLVARELPDITLPEELLPYELIVSKQFIEKAAYLGFAKAQLKMGQAYELSQLGCDFNPAYSLHYYGLAAHQGQPEAALGVSRWFLFGFESVFPKNEPLAYKYALDAANSGLATGEFAMGYYHEIGIHVQKDVREARRWYELAAEHGNTDARGRLNQLSQSKTLTKQDHETTTLTRIKSQHGSQRGKRPERFAKQNDVMPTLPEGAPGQQPPAEFPDPSRTNTMNSRTPAFTVNLDNTHIAMHTKPNAPYPEDDRPPPLSLKNTRPNANVPYPEDDIAGRPQPSPRHNTGAYPPLGPGPAADRPSSAFGVRPTAGQGAGRGGPGGPGGPGAGRGGQGPANGPPGSRPLSHSTTGDWEPQVPGGYRQASSPSRKPVGQQDPYGYGNEPPQRLGAASVGPTMSAPTGSVPIGDPTRTRLQKANPNYSKPQPLNLPPQGQGPPGNYNAQLSPTGPQPGREYGARVSSRPTSSISQDMGLPSTPLAGGFHPRPDNYPSPNGAAGGGGGRVPSGGRPGQYDQMAGRASAPPGAGQGLGGRPNVASPGPNMGGPSNAPNAAAGSRPGTAKPASSNAHPDGKTMGQGPATFEEMGIPQGKNEGDCLVM